MNELLCADARKSVKLMLCVCSQVKGKAMFSEASCSSSRISVEFHLEAGHLLYFYYESAMARDHFDDAVRLSGVDVQLTGDWLLLLE